MLEVCCGLTHPWDTYQVESRWLPDPLHCLIIGENPGSPDSEYFYQVPKDYLTDPVVVRRAILQGLFQTTLISEPTLLGFREGGFIFDHAIRCQRPSDIVKAERQRAPRYKTARVKNPIHLRPLLEKAPLVWIMGHLASNAVANLDSGFPKIKRLISKAPFPGPVLPKSKYFLSEYFTWRNEKQTLQICEKFSRFAKERNKF
jgi:hypothetical protein